MALVRLLDQNDRTGRGMSDPFRLPVVPAVGQSIAVAGPHGGRAVYEILAQTFEVILDQRGRAGREACIVLTVELLEGETDNYRHDDEYYEAAELYSDEGD